ncbi:MAG: endoribonuclease MazF [Planctomycetes bacterium]|nr:endoribonuclease MazF [Planctomycetota bacterium]
MRRAYAPQRGDLVWLRFDLQAGHEQAGHRPALVISPERYNRKVGLALCCPITSQIEGYPFEVILPPGLPVSGAVLADQVKALDWRVRRTQRIAAAPATVVEEVLGKLAALLSSEEP